MSKVQAYSCPCKRKTKAKALLVNGTLCLVTCIPYLGFTSWLRFCPWLCILVWAAPIAEFFAFIITVEIFMELNTADSCNCPPSARKYFFVDRDPMGYGSQ